MAKKEKTLFGRIAYIITVIVLLILLYYAYKYKLQNY